MTETKGDRRAGLLWLTATLGTVLVGWAVPLLFDRRFYFADDTQAGAFGIWYRLGQNLRAGDLPIFEVSSWMSGNYAAEGQWGLFSPLVLGIGWFASFTGDANLFSAAVKLVFLLVAAAGTYLLARGYGATYLAAFAAGLAAPLAGFTLYMDAATWVTGLMVWSLLPWFVLGLRRLGAEHRNPWLALVAAYLIITVGYVHGTIMVAGVVAIAIVGRLVVRDRTGAVRVLVAGVIAGMVALAVYLPGVLTAGVTERDSSRIFNDGFMTVDLSGVLASSVSTALPQISFWWGTISPAPVLYISWLLPLLVLLDWPVVRRTWREYFPLLAVLVLSTALTLAPSNMGPLRFPARMYPYVALFLLVLLAVLLSRARCAAPGRGRVAAAAVVFGAGVFLGLAQAPQYSALMLRTVVVSVVGLWLLLLLARRDGRPLARLGTPVVAGAVIAAVTLVLLVDQQRAFPGSPAGDFELPAAVSEYQTQLDGAVGDTIVVGKTVGTDVPYEDLWDETLLANTWYLNEHSVQNTYTPLLHVGYAAATCMNWRGETCADLAENLFEVDPETGTTLADRLSVDTVQIIKASVPASARRTAPEGWSLLTDTDIQVTWVRDVPRGPAGSVAWTSDGVEVEVVRQDDRHLTMRLLSAPEDGGTVMLSRLYWPGYSAENAEIVDPTDDFLLTLEVSAADVGQDVEVSFSPPGWRLELSLLAAAILLGAAWTALDRPTRRRRRPLDPAPSTTTDVAVPATSDHERPA